jgi:hypothetical protein
MEAKIVLKKGMQWRIGDCSNVKIWLIVGQDVVMYTIFHMNKNS